MPQRPVIVMALAAAACSARSGESPDAPPADAALLRDSGGCLTNAPSPTVPDPIVIAGLVRSMNPGGPVPLADAQVDAVTANGVVATATSDAAGLFALSTPTGGQPFSGRLRATANEYVPTNLLFADPLRRDVADREVPMIQSSLLPLLGSIAGTPAQPGDGQGVFQLVDCDGALLAGATVTLSGGDPDTRVVYGAGNPPLPSPNATATDASGTVFVLNGPPGGATLTGALDGAALQSLEVSFFADEITGGWMHP